MDTCRWCGKSFSNGYTRDYCGKKCYLEAQEAKSGGSSSRSSGGGSQEQSMPQAQPIFCSVCGNVAGDSINGLFPGANQGPSPFDGQFYVTCSPQCTNVIVQGETAKIQQVQQMNQAIAEQQAAAQKENEAIQRQNAVVQRENEASEAYKRGEEYRLNDQNDQAIKEYSEAIRLNPKLAFAYGGRGEAYRCKGQYDQAINDFNERIRLDSNSAFAYTARGVSYIAKGMRKEGIEDFEKALNIDPNYKWAKDQLAFAKQMIDLERQKAELEKMLAEKKAQAAAQPSFCGNCGSKMEPGVAFCGNCGSKM